MEQQDTRRLRLALADLAEASTLYKYTTYRFAQKLWVPGGYI